MPRRTTSPKHDGPDPCPGCGAFARHRHTPGCTGGVVDLTPYLQTRPGDRVLLLPDLFDHRRPIPAVQELIDQHVRDELERVRQRHADEDARWPR